MERATDDVIREIQGLRARLDELEREIAGAGTPAGPVDVGASTADDTATVVEPAPDGRTPDRRRLLGLAAAAVGAGAVAVVSQAGPVAATDGQDVLIGSTRSAQSTTGLVATETFAGPVLALRKTNTAYAQYNAALQAATSESGGYAVVGLHDGPNGSAVVGYHTGTGGSGGVGVFGNATGPGGRGGSFEGVQAAIKLEPNGSAPGRANAERGDIVMDTQNNLWLCVNTFPQTWRLLGGAASAGALRMLASPYRCHDTRPGEGPASLPKTKITTGQERTVDTGLGGDVPSYARAALVNITATQTDAAGWFSAFPFGTAWPGTSTLNWSATNSNVANSTIVAIDTSGRFTLRGQGSAHAIVDVQGFF